MIRARFEMPMFWKKQRQDAEKVLRCSFCHKAQEDVRKLIAGPSVFICDECLEVCNDIVADDPQLSPGPDVRNGLEPRQFPELPVSGPAVPCALCRLPTPTDDGVLIPNRGVLCPGCIGEIEATVAETRQQGSSS